MTEKEIRSILEAAAEAATGRMHAQEAALARRFIVNCIVVTFTGLGLCGTIFGVIWVHDSQKDGPTDPGVLGALCFLGFLCVLPGAFALMDVVKASANKEGISIEAENHIRAAVRRAVVMMARA
jgi:hypothetical protein